MLCRSENNIFEFWDSIDIWNSIFFKIDNRIFSLITFMRVFLLNLDVGLLLLGISRLTRVDIGLSDLVSVRTQIDLELKEELMLQ
jgi:hypothetical protein